MTVVDSGPTAQRAPGLSSDPVPPGAKVRILETADRLFYSEGIRTVGIDRLISESAVTKATFYKHYGSKDRLIIEYITGRHLKVIDRYNRLAAKARTPHDLIPLLVTGILADIDKPGFRGCPFLNAASEFPDPRHPVREVVSMHRDWTTDVITAILRSIGHPMPGDGADDIVLARDGALSGGYAGDPISSSAAFKRTVARVTSDARA
ncbi:TetR/AcrR family transcriptional regulator [Marisediminicola senii]|uniref:TetR/AcrR family transcriptional regulator n=1 Tax=Marisediminicola senii TaxID=2711233 RepID=UPI0013EA40F1|nr:TetR/AcrR family transcriptional regulator [Marisediminicola senii]